MFMPASSQCTSRNLKRPTHTFVASKEFRGDSISSMQANDNSLKLIDALQDRNININTTELIPELSDGNQSVRGTWIEENLRHEILLTKEELSL